MQNSPFLSYLAVAVTTASTHYAQIRRDGQAELAWVAWLNTKTVYPQTVTRLSTNLARRRVTSLMRPTMLPLSQTATATSHRHILCSFGKSLAKYSHLSNSAVLTCSYFERTVHCMQSFHCLFQMSFNELLKTRKFSNVGLLKRYYCLLSYSKITIYHLPLLLEQTISLFRSELQSIHLCLPVGVQSVLETVY